MNNAITLTHYTDENECETDPCDYNNTECINTDGSFYCSCVEGYTGNGTLCMEIITPTVPGKVDNCSAAKIHTW